jgi:hypothetical protein
LILRLLRLQVQKSSFSVKSNFFELGGNSLRAGLINSKIRRATGADISGEACALLHWAAVSLSAAISLSWLQLFSLLRSSFMRHVQLSSGQLEDRWRHTRAVCCSRLLKAVQSAICKLYTATDCHDMACPHLLCVSNMTRVSLLMWQSLQGLRMDTRL